MTNILNGHHRQGHVIDEYARRIAARLEEGMKDWPIEKRRRAIRALQSLTPEQRIELLNRNHTPASLAALDHYVAEGAKALDRIEADEA